MDRWSFRMDILKTLLNLAELIAKAFKWIMDGDTKRKVWAIAAALLIAAAVGLTLTPQSSRDLAYKAAWPWMAAFISNQTILLSDNQAALIDRRTAMLTQNVRQELLDTLDPKRVLNDKASRYTAWVLAENAVALLMTDEQASLPAKQAREIETFVRQPRQQLAECDCWNEFIDNKAAPQHVAISAWILFALAKIGQQPSAGELQFLLETQDGAGGWNMFNVPYGITADPGLQRPQGSSFATAWVMLAMAEMLRNTLISDPAQSTEIARRGRHAVDFFLRDRSSREPDSQLWSLYPGWKGSTDLSMGTSGLVIFALHRYLANFNAADLSVYAKELAVADRNFLAALPRSFDRVPKPNDGDNFGYALAYEPVTSHGRIAPIASGKPSATKGSAAPVSAFVGDSAGSVRIDSVTSLNLPWMIIGAQAAFASGDYLARVQTLQFIDLALRRFDEGVDSALQQHYWMAPELLMSLRYLREPNSIQR